MILNAWLRLKIFTILWALYCVLFILIVLGAFGLIKNGVELGLNLNEAAGRYESRLEILRVTRLLGIDAGVKLVRRQHRDVIDKMDEKSRAEIEKLATKPLAMYDYIVALKSNVEV